MLEWTLLGLSIQINRFSEIHSKHAFRIKGWVTKKKVVPFLVLTISSFMVMYLELIWTKLNWFAGHCINSSYRFLMCTTIYSWTNFIIRKCPKHVSEAEKAWQISSSLIVSYIHSHIILIASNVLCCIFSVSFWVQFIFCQILWSQHIDWGS